ncbi:hypothetical protein [Eikenella sp. Marseille-P7795]|uniref:hypothetical protein n=1 Tax=Eikenella sp. Marseille-P7795 TaxID=2866577 RepID=UPI000A6DB158|nr:hypothetical protein [Eikenella sp. Marseille-P7795]
MIVGMVIPIEGWRLKGYLKNRKVRRLDWGTRFSGSLKLAWDAGKRTAGHAVVLRHGRQAGAA